MRARIEACGKISVKQQLVRNAHCIQLRWRYRILLYSGCVRFDYMRSKMEAFTQFAAKLRSSTLGSGRV